MKGASNLFLSSLILGLLLFSLCLIKMAESATSVVESGGGSQSSVHIVYTETPTDEPAEAYHIRTLASVLGSEEAAKEALVYSYKTAASGFSAKLTPEQVAEISKQPGVLQVVPSKMVQLHTGTEKPRMGSVMMH